MTVQARITPEANTAADIMSALDRRVPWLSPWMIHNANQVRDSRDGLRVAAGEKRPVLKDDALAIATVALPL